METLIVNKQKSVVIERRQLGKVQLLTIRTVPEEKTYTFEEAREMTHKLIDKWVGESKK